MKVRMLGGEIWVRDDATVADLCDAIAAATRVPRETLRMYLDGGYGLPESRPLASLDLDSKSESALVAMDESERCSHGSFRNAFTGGYQCGNC